MEIIHEIEYHEEMTHFLCFNHVQGNDGAGYAFPCDEHGKVTPDNPCAAKNLAACLAGGAFDRRIESRLHRWHTSRVGRCQCGEKVYLDSFTNTCDRCGADYNSSGQLLAPREQWGEETGEHWSECY